MSILLKLLWAVLLLCLAVLLSVTAGLTYYQDEIEAKIAEKVDQAIGRELIIRDGFGFKFTPLPTVYAKSIVLANASWGTKPWMLEIEQVEVALSFIALAQGKLKVSDIKIDSPYFLFERKQGNLNWFFGGARKGKSPKPLDKLYKYLLLDKAVMDNAQFDIRINPRTHFIKLNRVTAEIQPQDQTIAIDLIGSAENRLIQVKGIFTDVKSLLLRETSQLQLAGTYGDMPISAQGSIEDVLRWHGLNAIAQATAPSLKFFQPWNRLKLPDTPPITASARLLQPQRWPTARLDEITIDMEGYGGNTNLVGRFDELQNWKGLYLEGTSVHKALPLLDKIGWAGSQDATIKAKYTLSGSIFKRLTLDVIQADLTGNGVVVSAKGAIDNLSAPDTSAVSIEASASSLHRVGALVGKPWPITTALQATAELAKSDGVYGLSNIEGSAYDSKISVRGDIKNVGPFATGKFQANGTLMAADIAALNEDNSYLLPEADSSQLSMNITYADKLFSAKEASVEMVFADATVTATGAIEDMASLELNGASVQVDMPNVAPFNSLYDLALPQLGHLKATGALTGNFSGRYTLDDFIGNIKSTNHLFDIKGSILNLGKEMQAALEVQGEAKKFDDFQPNLETLILPANTGTQAKFKLTSSSSNNWSVSELQADLFAPAKGQVTGGVFNFPLQTEYQLNVDIESLNISNIQQIADIAALKGRFIDAAGEVSTKPGGEIFNGENINALISQPNTATTLKLAGAVSDIATFSGLNLIGHLTGDDFISVPEFSGLDFKSNLPFDFKFNLQSEPQSTDLDFNIQQAQVADSDVSGNIHIKFSESEKSIPHATGTLHSKHLNIIDLMTEGERKNLFSDAPFSLDWASSFNANIELNVEDFNGLISNIRNTKAQLKLNNGFISLPGATGKIGEGDLTWWLAIDSTSVPYNIISSMQGEDLDSKELNLFGDSGLIRDGLIDVDMGISGQGVSIAEMMGTAYGKLQLQLKNASLKNQNLELFGSDLILGFLNTINPLSRQEEYLDIECGVIHFPIKDGKAYADQGIAIKTERVTVLGGGQINLKNENLSILIKPKARKGFGVSAGTIAKIIQIGGTIDEPKIEVAASGFFATAAAIGAAAVSGGWTLLAQGLLDRNKANSDVCKQTLHSPVFTTENRDGSVNGSDDLSGANK